MTDAPAPWRRRAFVSLVRAATAGRWRAFDRAADAPRAASLAALRRILRRNAASEFGRKHGFARIDSFGAWRDAVPVADYEAFEPAIERLKRGEQGVLTADPVTFFGQSSGTTGRPKFIPVTAGFLAEVRRARSLLIRPAVERLPGLLGGKALGVSSSRIVGWTEAGIPYGSVTAKYDRKGWADRFQMIPFEVHAMEDFEAKYYLLLRLALEHSLSVVSTVNSSTVVLLARKLDAFADRLIADLRAGTVDPDLPLLPAVRAEAERRVRGPRPEVALRLVESRRANGFVRWIDVWPAMAAIFCWKAGAAAFYLRQFPARFGSTPVFDLGFAATEGVFSAPMDPDRDDGVLVVDGHVMEFIPESRRDDHSPPVLDASELERGGRYHILITTGSGLYRYDLNDVIEVTDFYRRTPMVRFLHKGGGIVSITGEKLAESHVVLAMDAALRATGAEVAGFTCALDLGGETPRYRVLVEPARAEGFPAAALLRHFDTALGRANEEYRGKRDSLRLGAPTLAIVAPGAYEGYRRRRLDEGAHDSHVKTPHLTDKPAVVAAFEIRAEIPWTDA